MFDFENIEEKGADLQKVKNKLKTPVFNFQNIPRVLILGLVFLLPIFFLPISIASLSSSKTILVYLIALIALAVIILNNFNLKKIEIPFNLFGLSIILVPVVYIISGIFSNHISISFLGRDLALDTVTSIIIFFVLACMSTLIIGAKKQQVLYTYLLLFLSSVIVAVVQIFHLLIPTLPDLGIFTFPISTTLGKWNDLGLFSVLVVMLSAITIEQVKLVKPVRIFLYVTFILNLIIVGLVNFIFGWYLLIAFSVFFLIYQAVVSKKELLKKVTDWRINFFPKTALITLVIAILFVFFGNFVNTFTFNYLGISHVEARPSFESTIQITQQTLNQSPVLGSGPATFEVQWPKYRPQEILLTNFWNNDFRYGYGLIPSFMTTTGILGTLSWAFFFVMFFIFAMRAFMKKKVKSETKFIILSSFTGTITLWLITLFYLPSITLFVLAFIFTGIFISVLKEIDLFNTKEITLGKSDKVFTLSKVIGVALIILVILVGYKTTSKFVAHSYFQKSVYELTRTSNAADIETKIFRAADIDPIDTYFRSIAEINVAKLENMILAANSGQDISQDAAREVANNVIRNYDKAISYDSNNYNNYISLANFYRGLLLLGTEGVYETSRSFYGQALELKPNNPVIYLELARLEAVKGDNLLTRAAIEEALKLKPNYSDAVFFLAQYEVEKGRADKAVNILESASKRTPNDPLLYFQLGVLNYSLENYEESKTALESAITLNSGLQNAKYFLGLSYYELGRVGDSIKQFKELLAKNPGNQEIEFIINNLTQGNSPFFGAEDQIIQPIQKEELPFEDTVDTPQNIIEDDSDEIVEDEDSE